MYQLVGVKTFPCISTRVPIKTFPCVSEPADEVLYVDERDGVDYMACRNNKWTDPERVCRMSNVYKCDGTSQCGEELYVTSGESPSYRH